MDDLERRSLESRIERLWSHAAVLRESRSSEEAQGLEDRAFELWSALIARAPVSGNNPQNGRSKARPSDPALT